MEGDTDSWTIPPAVINTFCYIQGTFTLPRALAGDIGRDIASPGVGPYNYDKKQDDITIHAYYQWVPFVLFLQVSSTIFSLK